MKALLIGFVFLMPFGNSKLMKPSTAKPDPVRHHLLYRWSPHADPIKKQEFVNLFLKLENHLPGIDRVIVEHLNISKEEYNLFIVLHFKSEQALRSYQQHDLHQRIVQLAKMLTEDYTYFQY